MKDDSTTAAAKQRPPRSSFAREGKQPSGDPAGAGPDAAEFVRAGIGFPELQSYVSFRRQWDIQVAESHGRAERRWRLAAGILAWVTAALAAVSGVSAVAEQEQVAIALALLTALVAATNAAVNPADVARQHRTAALEFARMSSRLGDLLFFELASDSGEVPIDEVRKIRAELTKMDADALALR